MGQQKKRPQDQTMTIIVDSDGLIGLLDKQDTHFFSAQTILQKLIKKEVKLIYPATVVVESTTILKLRLKKPDLADQIAKLLLNGQLFIAAVDGDLLRSAVNLLGGQGGDKHNTLFDAVVVAIAQKYQADAIFSFDKFYKTNGFKLAGEL